MDVSKMQALLAKAEATRAEQYALTGDNKNWFMMKEDGEYYIRVVDSGDFILGSHWGILNGKDGKMGGSIRCPKAFDNSPCPVCEMVEQLANSKDPDDLKRAKKVAMKIKLPLIVFDLDSDPECTKPLIYEAPQSVYDQISAWGSNAKYGNLLDHNGGRNITLIRQRGKNKIVQYKVQPDPDKTKVDMSDIELPDLREMLAPKSYEDIEYAIMHNQYPEKSESYDSDEEVETKKKPKKPTTYKKKTPKPKVEDEEEYEDDEELEEEVEEKPAPKKATKKASSPKKSDSDDALKSKLAAMMRNKK